MHCPTLNKSYSSSQMTVIRLSLLLVLGSVVSCGQPATSGGFDSPIPAARLHALRQAARSGDRSSLKRIVELLDSDDAAVRLLAILTLERLTGETYGYHHYAPRWDREASIRLWINAIKQDTFSELKPVGEQYATGESDNG